MAAIDDPQWLLTITSDLQVVLGCVPYATAPEMCDILTRCGYRIEGSARLEMTMVERLALDRILNGIACRINAIYGAEVAPMRWLWRNGTRNPEVKNTAPCDASESKRTLPWYVIKCRDVINRRYHEPILNCNDIATDVGLSVWYVGRRFKACEGRTLMQALRQRRLDAAAELLVTTEQPVKVIAYATGYTSTALFTRHFSTDRHVSPSVFRLRHKKTSDRTE